MTSVRSLAPIALSGLLLGCTSTRSKPAPTEDPAAVENAAAMRGLRRMFPELKGEVTRESIAAEIARETAERNPAEGVRSDAVRAIQAGDFDRGRDLLGELLAADLVERARAATAAGDLRGALVALDHALEVAPRSPSILCARGEAVLALPAKERDAKLLESARANFLAAVALDAFAFDPGPNLPRAWLGASRVERGLGLLADAGEHARRGIAVAGAAPEETVYADPLRRALAEAVFDDYAAARSSGAPADALATRARTTRDALEDLLGRTPEEPWPWARLAELAESERAPAEARDLAARGLRIAPDDEALLARLALAARALGGPAAAVEAFERVCRDHPDVAPAARELGRALYDAAIEDWNKARDPRSKLAAAEAAALQARRLAPGTALAESASDLAAQCRGALGMWKAAQQDYAGAHTALLSMEDVRKGGLALEIPSTGSRGTDGLFRVANAFGARGEIDGLEQAAKICDLLHQVDPKDGRFAAGAGTFHEEAAIQLELQARAAQKKPEDAERLLARARETMEAAFLALAEAARLSPEDERVLARAGEVLGRYLQRDAEAAIGYLEKALSLGDAKLPKLRERAAEPGLADAERQARRKVLDDEETLVGDAAENLGRVHLKLLGDAAKARSWLERSRRTGADPRPGIDELIAQCDDAIARKTDPRVKDENRWAAPVPHGRTP
jgi:predicted Zn-dependent protease